MNKMQEAAIKLSKDIAEIKNSRGEITNWTAPHELWPFIEQLQSKGLALTSACWLVRNWICAGWVPPSIVAQESEKEISILREEMSAFKKTMVDMQEWYSKLDDFLKVRDKPKTTK